jgi:[acyl-carrier-protein] S-malonyltransferase
MAPVAAGLAQVLESVPMQPLGVGVITNVAAEINTDHQRVKDSLIQQVTAPVRWEESMQRLVERGCEVALEVGPGRVLAGLLKRLAPALPCVSVSDPETLTAAREVLS